VATTDRDTDPCEGQDQMRNQPLPGSKSDLRVEAHWTANSPGSINESQKAPGHFRGTRRFVLYMLAIEID
jgi:hypothetical protein